MSWLIRANHKASGRWRQRPSRCRFVQTFKLTRLSGWKLRIHSAEIEQSKNECELHKRRRLKEPWKVPQRTSESERFFSSSGQNGWIRNRSDDEPNNQQLFGCCVFVLSSAECHRRNDALITEVVSPLFSPTRIRFLKEAVMWTEPLHNPRWFVSLFILCAWKYWTVDLFLSFCSCCEMCLSSRISSQHTHTHTPDRGGEDAGVSHVASSPNWSRPNSEAAAEGDSINVVNWR